MSFQGRLVSPTDPGLVPALFQGVAKCHLVQPRPDIDLVLVTSSHIVELTSGRIARSSRLEESLPVVERVHYLPTDTGWFYILECEETLAFLTGKTLEEEKRYENTDSLIIGDFFQTGGFLVYIKFRFQEPVLTDGLVQYDLSQPWPPDQTPLPVEDALAKRLDISGMTVEAARMELETTRALIQQSFRSLAKARNPASCLPEAAIADILRPHPPSNYLQSLDNPLPPIKLGATWVRSVGTSLVIIAELEVPERPPEVTHLAMSEVTHLCMDCIGRDLVNLNCATRVVTIKQKCGKPVPQEISTLAKSQRGYGILVIPQTLLTLSNRESVTLTIFISSKQGDSAPVGVSLSSPALITGEYRPRWSSLVPQEATADLLAVVGAGVRTGLRLRTGLGSLASCQQEALPTLGFSLHSGLNSCIVKTCDSCLYCCVLVWSPVSGREVEVDAYAPDYSTLGMCVKSLRSVLPSDTKILPREVSFS